MNTRLRISILVLVSLIAANIGWRIWANWGLVTIDADEAPVRQVTRNIEKQTGIHLVTNAGPDAKITMHVHKVPLLRALQVLSSASGGSWSVGYVAAPDKVSINNALTAISNGGDMDGWKKFVFAIPGMPGFGFSGMADPREEKWATAAEPDGKLQTYLNQGAQSVDAQFWAPGDWNPQIATPPPAGKVGKVMQQLAKDSHGTSEEVFLLLVPTQAPQGTASASMPAQRPPDGGFGGGPPGGGMPDPAMRAVMDKRIRAQIDALPPEKKTAATAEYEERRKFFEEIAQLPPEERAAKMRERVEEDMRSGRMESRFVRMTSSRTAEERSNFNRMILQRKAESK